MKVTREKGFAPITIVLETEDEAEHMWHKLNCNDGFSKYAEQRNYCIPGNLDFEMWEEFNNIYELGDE